MNAKLEFDAQNIVGESLVWDDRRQCLFWVDIIAKLIHRLDPSTGVHESWPTPDFVTSIGLREDGGAIVSLTKRICLWDFDDDFRTLVEVEKDTPNNRLNEGVVGPDGTFWVGTMQNNIAPDGSPIDIDEDTGRIYRCLPDGSVQQVCDDVFGITNTFVWPDENWFITADTLKNEIYRYTLDPETGAISGRTTIVNGYEHGLPDGSTMDEKGGIWNCRVVGGNRVLNFDSSGQIGRAVKLPCSWPTSCTFGGEKLDRLFVTSARFTMTEDHLMQTPQEGGLFSLDVGVKGHLHNRFASPNVSYANR